jgi:hypothetical protein
MGTVAAPVCTAVSSSRKSWVAKAKQDKDRATPTVPSCPVQHYAMHRFGVWSKFKVAQRFTDRAKHTHWQGFQRMVRTSCFDETPEGK